MCFRCVGLVRVGRAVEPVKHPSPGVTCHASAGGLRVSPLEPMMSFDSTAHGLASREGPSAPRLRLLVRRVQFQRAAVRGRSQSGAVQKLCEEGVGCHRTCTRADGHSRGGGRGKLQKVDSRAPNYILRSFRLEGLWSYTYLPHPPTS